MGPRLATGLTGAVVVVGAVWLGAPWLTLLTLLAGGLAAGEFCRLAPEGAAPGPGFLSAVAAVALLLAAAMAGPADYWTASGLTLAAWGLIAVLWFTARYTGGRPGVGFVLLLAGPVYAGFLLGHGLQLRELSGGAENLGRSWLLLTLLAVFACDTGAFAVGRLVGRHRMAPRISPNKTWEGAAGGFVAAVGAGLLAGAVFDLGVAVWQAAAAGATVGVAAQAGDLAESALKRAAKVKDSGSIMPGHGGILDRMDSILFALPAVYYLAVAGFGL